MVFKIQLTIHLKGVMIGGMSGRNKKRLIWLIIGVIAVGFVYLKFFRGNAKTDKNPEPSPTIFIEESSPTVEPTIAKADIKMRVLNGSGVIGEAGRVKAILEKAEFTVESTANADAYDHQDTEIKAKKGVSTALIDELKELLNEYATLTTAELEVDSEVDIVLTIGVRKTPPTSAVKPSPTGQKTVTPTATGQQTSTSTLTITPTPTPTPTKAV